MIIKFGNILVACIFVLSGSVKAEEIGSVKKASNNDLIDPREGFLLSDSPLFEKLDCGPIQLICEYLAPVKIDQGSFYFVKHVLDALHIFQQFYGPIFYIGEFTNGQVIYAFEKLKCFVRVKRALPKSLKNFLKDDLGIIGNFGSSLALKTNENSYGKLLMNLVGLLDCITDKSARLTAIKHYISSSSFPKDLKLADTVLFDRVIKESIDFETIQRFCQITRVELYPRLGVALMHYNIDDYPDLLPILNSLNLSFGAESSQWNYQEIFKFPRVEIYNARKREKIYKRNRKILLSQLELYYRPYLKFINLVGFGSPNKISQISRNDLLNLFSTLAIRFDIDLEPGLMIHSLDIYEQVKLISLFWDRGDAITELNGLSQNFDWGHSLALLALNPVEYLQRNMQQLIGDYECDFDFFICNCLEFRKTEMRNLFENELFKLADSFIQSDPGLLSSSQSRFIILAIRLASAWNSTEILIKLGNFLFSHGFDEENINLIPVKSDIWDGPLAAVFVQRIGSKGGKFFARIIVSALIRNDQFILQLVKREIKSVLEVDLLNYSRLLLSPIYLERLTGMLKDGSIKHDNIKKINEQLFSSYCDESDDASCLSLKPEADFVEFWSHSNTENWVTLVFVFTQS